MPLAIVALDEARLLLNDVGAKLATNAVLLPFLKKAFRELQQNLVDNGVSTARATSAAITVPAAITGIFFTATPDPELPPNLLYPIELDEKLVGQDDINYTRMTESVWPLDLTAEIYRRFWAWNQDEILFPAATGDTIIRIRYWGSLPPIADETTNIEITDSETFLGSRTAALAALVIRKDAELASACAGDANQALGILLSTAVKNRQANPVRRRKFRSFVGR